MKRREPRSADCDCPESGESLGAGFTRRAFLRRGALVAAATGLVGHELSTQLAFASTPAYSGDVLIVLSLRGGVDGLSIVVPRNDAFFQAQRPNIRVPEAQMLALGTAGNGNDNRFGLHPAMAPLMPMWAAGTFGVVHAVGQVNPTRSHFEATEELEKAAPGSSLRTGWLDRMLGDRAPGTVFQACELGGGDISGAFAGPAPVLGMDDIDGFGLSGAASDGSDLPKWSSALRGLNVGAPVTVQAPVTTTLGALATVKSLGAYVAPTPPIYDPDSNLAGALRDVARLIKAGVGLQAAAVDYSDWDMHAGLADGHLDPTTGWMHDKVTELATALAAFFTDLGPTLAAKVSLITMSEFGRRVEENGSNGLDHGHGNAVLLLGGGIVGGKVHGTWGTSISNVLDDQGDLAATTDYRNLLGELLVERCGAPSVTNVFPGLSYAPIGIAS